MFTIIRREVESINLLNPMAFRVLFFSFSKISVIFFSAFNVCSTLVYLNSHLLISLCAIGVDEIVV